MLCTVEKKVKVSPYLKDFTIEVKDEGQKLDTDQQVKSREDSCGERQ